MIAEKDKVYEEFPTPLINRLEKHFVLTSSVLEAWQEEVLNEFEAWISHFCNTRYLVCQSYMNILTDLCTLYLGVRNFPKEMLSLATRKTPQQLWYFKPPTFSGE